MTRRSRKASLSWRSWMTMLIRRWSCLPLLTCTSLLGMLSSLITMTTARC